MKKSILLILLLSFFISRPLFAQSVFVGTTPKGGTEDVGLLATYDSAGSIVASQDFFKTEIPGQINTGGIIKDNYGYLYGLTVIGGDGGFFRYNIATHKGELIHKFLVGDTLGYLLSIDLVIKNDLIYLKTIYGGANGKGVLFTYNTTDGVFNKIIDCSSTFMDGCINRMIKHSNGNFYGILQQSSSFYFFKYNPTTNAYTIISSLSTDTFKLLLDSSGTVYLVGSGGGAMEKYNTITNTFTTLFSFSGGDPVFGDHINAACLGPNNKIYLTTDNPGAGGAGTLLRYDIPTNILSRLYVYPTLTGPPYLGLICEPGGKIYNSNTSGQMFAFNTNDSSASIINTRYGQRAIQTFFYDTASATVLAFSTFGPVMSVDTAHNTLQNEYFIGSSEASYPSEGLIPGTGGKYYSLLQTGGTYIQGSIIEYDPITGLSLKTLIDDSISGNVAHGSGSDFYFFTKKGLSKYNSSANRIDTLHTWIGSVPLSTPSYYTDGNIYGASANGGVGGNGYIYKYDLGTNLMTNLYNFNGVNGKKPSGELTLSPNGYLYGLTIDGGSSGTDRGVLFKFNPLVPGSFSVVVDFDLMAGMQDPYGKIIFAGHCIYGVVNNKIFKYDTVSTLTTMVHDFISDTIHGYEPAGQLIISSNGKIYGATNSGGLFHKGVIYEIDTLTNVYTKLTDLDGTTNGAFFNSGATNIANWHLTEVICPSPTTPVMNAIGIINKCVGSTLCLYPTNVVSNAMNYYWYKDASLLPGLNKDSLVINNLSVADSGYYILKITNACGAFVFSDTIKLNLSCDVWPGDADMNNIVDNNDLLPIGLFYGQTGPLRSLVSDSWQAWPSSNWGIVQFNGQDIKHVDCNGDGVIDNNDTLAVNLNFSSVHAFAPLLNNSRSTNPDLYFQTSASSYLPGDWVNVDVMAGTSALPVTNLYGLAFNINYDASFVQSGTENLTYPASWFATPGTNAIKISKVASLSNTVFGAETRINHMNADGFGKIATFRFQTSTSITSSSTMNFYFSSYIANDSIGDSLFFNPLPFVISIVPSGAGITELNNSNSIFIYPNPYSGQTNISYSLKEKANVNIEVYTSLGEKVQTVVNNSQAAGDYKYTFSAKEKGFDAGIYFVKFTIDGKTSMRRIVQM